VIRGVGIDLVDVDRFRRTLARRPGLIERLFTPSERAYCLERNDPTERFAVRFAAKEATLKSMGVGIGAVEWHDIEVGRSPEGRPSLDLSGRAATLAGELGIVRFELSMTHTSTMAQAEVIAIGEGVPARRGQARMAQWRGEVGERPLLDPIIAGGLVPIVTPAEMNDIDRAAPEPVDELISRAGAALARHSIRMLGGTYGRRLVVLVGKGNNGNDGRDAARRLTRRGVRVRIVDVANAPAVLPSCDLVIDAACGSGFRADDARPFVAPLAPAGALVLAVDIPSGVDGLTGQAGTADALTAEDVAAVMTADETITFAALKPGLLFADGSRSAGRITVADIGLDVSRASAHLLGATAVAGWLTERSPDAHKWNSAVCVVAGGPGMEGAAALVSRAALRAGAGYVRLSMPTQVPTVPPSTHPAATAAVTTAVQLPTEVVRRALPSVAWADDVLADLGRFQSLVIGNGLGLTPQTLSSVVDVLEGAKILGLPSVVDADGLTALAAAAGGQSGSSGSSLTSDAYSKMVGPNTVLTPHDGEFARLDGSPPGPDRIAAARRLAGRTGAVVLLKGPSTVIASPSGEVLVSTTGDVRLATAGTGDVLAGIIGALLAAGLDPFRAAAAGAFIHGRAGALGWRHGTVAGDLPWRIPAVLQSLS
jgi:NAD(P)H-hydrate epimerase